MDINKGDLVKVWTGAKLKWVIVADYREDVGVVFGYCLKEEDEVYFEEWEIEQVVHAESTGQFLSVLSQKEKIAYTNYYVKEAGNMLTDIENRISGDTWKDFELKSTQKTFKYRLEDGDIHSVAIDKDFTDQNGVPVKNLRRYTSEEMDSWSKGEGLFDPFDDQTPYPLDFDNFVYGDVKQCYDEERDYLVIKCVDDFIEHMMTTR